MTDPIERAARALCDAWMMDPDMPAWVANPLDRPAPILWQRYAPGVRAAILAFLDSQEDGVAEAIQDAADIDANSMTYARSVLRALRKAAGGGE